MNPTWEDPIADEDDDENIFDKGLIRGRDAVIFLIDASSGMFQAHESAEETAFEICLKCARTTLTNKIISSNKDVTGIVFYGTDKTKNTRNNTDFKHIYVFQDLSEPGAERILEVEELMNMNDDTFASEYGHSDDFSLADAFWACGIMFSNCKYTLAHRRILLFTIHDNPHAGSMQFQIQAKTKAKDLHDSNIDIDVFPIKRPNLSFDHSLFYKDIALTAEDEEYRPTDPSEKLDDLLIKVRCKNHKKRALGSIEFTLGEDLRIAFKMFKLVSPAYKPSAVKLAKENNAELTSVTNTFLSDTGEVLLPSSLKKFQEYAGKRIYFAHDEVKQTKHFCDPGLLLMGFKPKSCLKTHYHLRPSLFLYPDEKAINGSIRLCNALMIQCHKREYVPICRLIARQNEPPKFVALLPQQEHVDDHGNQTIPPGFHVVYLPFLEDIRCIKGEKKHNPSEPQVEKAKEIIKKLQFAYHPDTFENPVLQKHWRNIEALALNRDAPEEIIDYTPNIQQDARMEIDSTRCKDGDNFNDESDEFESKFSVSKYYQLLLSVSSVPTKDIIEKRAGKLIEEFKGLICSGGNQTNANFKRGATSPAYGAPSKSSRTEEIIIPPSLQQDTVNGLLARHKVNVLKEFCKQNGIRAGTKKADLIDAITRYYQQQPEYVLPQP